MSSSETHSKSGLLMRLKERIKSMRLSSKLLFTYTCVLAATFIVVGVMIAIIMHSALIRKSELELQSSNEKLKANIIATVDNATRNTLRVLAFSAKDTAEFYYRRYKEGELTEQEAKKRLSRVLLSQTIGRTGYIFAWDINESPQSIILAVHPKVQGQNVADVDFVQSAVTLKEGYIEYSWRNPGENELRLKAVYVTYFKPWNWVIAASSYKEEFSDLIGHDQLEKMILGIKEIRNGYSFILNSKGDVIAHPYISSGNYLNKTDSNGKAFIREICEKKNGTIEYAWKNSDDSTARRKLAVFDYIPELDWIVASTMYYDKIQRYATNSILLVAAFTLLLLVLITPVTIWISKSITKPLSVLREAFNKAASGNYSVRIPDLDTDNEVGELIRFFNRFMEQLELYEKKLRTEIDEHLKEISRRKQTEEKLHINARLLEDEIGERQQAQLELTVKQTQLEALNTTLENRIAQSVEDLRRKDSMLIQQNRLAAMGELLTNIAHQWRQPLNNISAYLQAMQFMYSRGEMTKEEMERDVGAVNDILQSLSKTIDDFRKFFRQDERPLEFLLREMLDKAMAILIPTLENHAIKIEITGQQDLRAYGLPAEYSQAVINILNNAMDALLSRNVKERRIEIELFAKGDFSVTVIRDNAGGIPDDILPQIFNPYFSTKNPGQGTGLGLYMAKTIIEQNMGGRLSAQNIGEGAELTIEIPLRNGAPI